MQVNLYRLRSHKHECMAENVAIFSGVLATHHCGHQIAAKNRLMSVTTLPSQLSMVFYQVIIILLVSATVKFSFVFSKIIYLRVCSKRKH
jgi:hypothetical protein